MSIDQRLRTGLRAADRADPVDPARLVDGWAEVVARADAQRSRDRVRRGVVGVAAAALVVAGAVTWWPHGTNSPEPLPPAPNPTSPTSSASASGAPSPIEGTWSSGPVSAGQVVDHLESVGLGQWADAALDDVPRNATVVYQLKLQGGRITMARTVDDAVPETQDVEGYEVSGDQVVFTPEASTCSTTLDWRVAGDQLLLRPVSDTCPPYRGTPDLAFMEALYGALAFTRTG
jgi:hypothetical protein